VREEKKMSSKDMFAGFKVPSGRARFNDLVQLRGEPYDCKLSGRDTAGAKCIFELKGLRSGPRRRHREQDEWIYVIDGDLRFVVGDDEFQAGSGESVFVPRQTACAWVAMPGRPARIFDVYQPAGQMEEFFRRLGKFNSGPPIHEVLSVDEFRSLFQQHGMEVAGPPLVGDWKIEGGRMARV
jgi:mannose-6-phosphate isomerase-like protein (cupin superfamily)